MAEHTYQCTVCGQEYDSSVGALRCEGKHTWEKIKAAVRQLLGSQ